MRIEVLRNPGLDLAHDLAAKGQTEPVEIPKDLTEGEVRDVPDNVADALIAVGVARKADKGAEVGPPKPTPLPGTTPAPMPQAHPQPQPVKGHATPAPHNPKN